MKLKNQYVGVGILSKSKFSDRVAAHLRKSSECELGREQVDDLLSLSPEELIKQLEEKWEEKKAAAQLKNSVLVNRESVKELASRFSENMKSKPS